MLATTTSVQNSGLLDALLPTFEKQASLRVQVHAAGSGRALQMLHNGTADVVISHAPDAERRLLATHPDWVYRKFAYNAFVIVGPHDDPAHVAQAADAIDAFRRIADSGATFVSRGDESGTHERENTFWEVAKTRPRDGRVLVSGGGMAQALRHADEARAYTLTDAPTFWQLGRGLALAILFQRDARLLNTYAVIHPPNVPEAEAFTAWLISGPGHVLVGSFVIEGSPAYEPWPLGCGAATPRDLPCAPMPLAPK